MGNKILVLGDSGSGKSTATRNLDPKTTFYVNVIGKPLPFKGWKAKYVAGKNLVVTNNHQEVIDCIKGVSEKMTTIKTIVVDDAQYIMSYEFMARAKERGFDKFTEIAQHMFNVLRAPDTVRDDLTTIFLSHSEDVSANGYTKTKMKTIGKMLDEKISIEGLFTVVLLCYPVMENKKMKYVFVTESNGTTTAKSPMDMFKEITVENDLQMVLDKIKKYEEE